MIAPARLGGRGASVAGRGAASLGAVLAMLPVGSGSPNTAGSNLEAAPLSGKETKLQGMTSSDSGAASRSSRSGGSVRGVATRAEGLSITQKPSRGAGNGLETASGTATKKTRTPHKAP